MSARTRKRDLLAPVLALMSSLLLDVTARAETSGQQLAESVGQKLIGTPAPKLELKTIDRTCSFDDSN